MIQVVSPKFNFGQKVWMLSNGKAVEMKVKDVTIFLKENSQQRNMYCLIGVDDAPKEEAYGYSLFNEDTLFPSKEDLQKYVFG